MRTVIKILICALIVIALVGIVYAQHNIPVTSQAAKKPHHTPTPTPTPTPTITIPTTYPTPPPNSTSNHT